MLRTFGGKLQKVLKFSFSSRSILLVMGAIFLTAFAPTDDGPCRFNSNISLDKMNMLYVGVDNPVSIGVGGMRPDQVRLEATGGTLREVAGKLGQYLINPPMPTADGGREIVFSLYGTIDGNEKKLAQYRTRVRPLPKPEILLGSKTGGSISRGELQSVNQLFAGLGESFAFEGINYSIESYDFTYVSGDGTKTYSESVTGNRVTSSMREVFSKAKTGDKIFISNVVSIGPSASGAEANKRYVNGPALVVK